MEIASTDYAVVDGKKRKRVSSDVVHVIDRGKGKKDQNTKVSQYLELLKKSIQDAIAKLDTSSGLSTEDVQKMKDFVDIIPRKFSKSHQILKHLQTVAEKNRRTGRQG